MGMRDPEGGLIRPLRAATLRMSLLSVETTTPVSTQACTFIFLENPKNVKRS